ncbi:CsiV family protein [Thiomicrorhabdus indica]|uniref:CsiV family protein n=1 Tax=Thiomicrorhabdus indica TaxID=2267253 RepID=UPI00102DC7B7|nr:CsiV family protein [Thiomicrorhabdus indica]
MILTHSKPTAKITSPTTVALVLVACLAGLFTTKASAEEKIQRYHIDMIIFEHLALKGWTEEYWPSIVDSAQIENVQDLTATGRSPLFIENANPMLDAEASRVAKNYRIITHQSWVQNALGAKESPKLFLEANQGSTSFYGTVKMYQSRFNHIEIDFNYERMIPNAVRSEFAQMQKIPLNDLPTHWPFHISAQRKMKSDELHYIDHPLFGVLLQIRKLD